jgi:glycosyltransferase involved in cell wall biosynthesis
MDIENTNYTKKQINDKNSVWCVIPVYNNAGTIKDIAEKCRSQLTNVLIIDDGSSDSDLRLLLKDINVTVIRHDKNMGKGKALVTALKYLDELDVEYMITIDGDGQLFPEDIPKFLPLLQENNHTIVVGCRNLDKENVPAKSRFGRSFSNLWLKIETGISVDDTQCGFRAYPVKYISRLKFLAKSYNFESEVLAKAAWAGIAIKNVPIKVWYPKKELRVSSFRPVLDNFRFALIHTYLIILRLLPIPHKRLVADPNRIENLKILFHPIKMLKYLVKEYASPKELGFAAGVGTFLAILPLIGFHTVAIIYASVRLHLNKVMSINIQHLFMPPFAPIVCMEVGYYMRHGHWLTTISFKTLCEQLPFRIYEWFLGSLVLAPICAVIIGFIVYVIAFMIKRKNKKHVC